MVRINKQFQKLSTLFQRLYSKDLFEFGGASLGMHLEAAEKFDDMVKDTPERICCNTVDKEELLHCKQCNEPLPITTYEKKYSICTKCNTHYRIDSEARIELIFDQGTVRYFDETLESTNPLNFPNYSIKLKDAVETLGIKEAVITGKGNIKGSPVYFGIMDYRFIMGSMGTIVGEKLLRLFEASIKDRVPVVVFCASGGARMQEGILSLYQMARLSAVICRHNNEGLLYISIFTDPTYGGVTASFASLGDILIAEQGANIGFAGKRIIENVIKQKTPKDFQTAEFMLKHGLIDYVVDRKDMRSLISNILKIHSISAEEIIKNNISFQLFNDIAVGKSELSIIGKNTATAWDRVLLSRNKQRPNFSDYIDGMLTEFTELHGDRYIGDDPAVVGGIGYIKDIPVTVIFHAKGKNIQENMTRNFGMAHPEGYKKALRLMKQAEKFRRPVICFVDTPGAFCGIEAENRGQGMAIAECLKELIQLKTPIITVITGEGGSGGALAFSVSDYTYMLENAIYSVISPESCAEIIFKDHTKAKEIAEHLKLTSADLLKLNIIDEIIEEPEGGAHTDPKALIIKLKNKLYSRLVSLTLKNSPELIEERYGKIMKKGQP